MVTLRSTVRSGRCRCSPRRPRRSARAARRENAGKGRTAMRARRVPHLFAGHRGAAARWRWAAVIVLAAALPAAAVTAAAPRAWAASGYAVTATIAVGSFPQGVAVDPTTGTAYVANFRGGTVSVIDEATDTVTATIGVSCMPQAVAVDPDTHTAYVADPNEGTVSVI